MIRGLKSSKFVGQTTSQTENSSMMEDSALKPQSGDVYYNVQEKLRTQLLQTYSKGIKSYYSIGDCSDFTSLTLISLINVRYSTIIISQGLRHSFLEY